MTPVFLASTTINYIPKPNPTRGTADAVERPSPAYLLRAARIDENTQLSFTGGVDPSNI